MKTPQQWVEVYQDKATIDDESLLGVYLTPSEITAIQDDAFESGRVGGRSFELNRMAQILRDSGDPKMEAMANSCERLASMIIQSKDEPCSKNTP